MYRGQSEFKQVFHRNSPAFSITIEKIGKNYFQLLGIFFAFLKVEEKITEGGWLL